MRKVWWLMVLVALVPVAGAANHLPTVTNVRVAVDSQRFQVDWDPVSDPDVVGYTVDVFTAGRLVRQINATAGPVTHYGQNNRAYAFVVHARDASGALGPPSDPAPAVATESSDLRYLAIGLSVLWAGLWGYALIVGRTETRARARLERIRQAKERAGGNR